MKPDVGMNSNNESKQEPQTLHHPPSTSHAPTQPTIPHQQPSQHQQHQNQQHQEIGIEDAESLVQRLNTHSYGQAREIIVKEMRANTEAITRLEARIETLVTILRQAGVEYIP